MNPTIRSLIKRGLAFNIAQRLSELGLTLGKLQQLGDQELKELDLNSEYIKKIRSGRPAIPDYVIDQVLYEANYTCCICKDRQKPYILHHIIPWEKSRNHAPENLVVLCLEDHGEAHTKRGISLSLTPKRILSAKAKWIKDVQEYRKNSVIGIVQAEYALWDYFHLHRLFELSDSLDIDYKGIKSYDRALDSGFIYESGYLKPMNRWDVKITSDLYLFDFYDRYFIVNYLKDIFLQILKIRQFKILNDMWSKSEILRLIKPGDFVLLQAAFHFKSLNKITKGHGQERLAYRKARGIRYEFIYDAYYCCSSSSKNDHMSGKRVSTAFSVVREILNTPGELVIKGSVIAVGCCFKDIPGSRNMIGHSLEYQNIEEIDDEDSEDII